MTKWSTISARITPEERKLVDEWEERMGLTDNQLVRGGVAIMIGFLQMGELLIKPELQPLRDYVEEMQKLTNYDKIQNEAEKVLEKTLSKYKDDQIEQFEKDMVKISEDLQVFEKHRPRGRTPKKKSRGRPKDTGLD